MRSLSRFQAPLIGMAFSLMLPTCGSLLATCFLSDWYFRSLPLHSTVEAVGGILALAIAGMLIVQHRHRPSRVHFMWLASSFFGMGVLDVFHACVNVGENFVWLHALATAVGGGLLGLVWLPRQLLPPRFRFWMPWLVGALTTGVGVLSCLQPGLVPAMTQAGQFTSVARTLNVVGGLGFALASLFFVIRFHRRQNRNDWLFAANSQLFAVAAILFELSQLWDSVWWWWHLMRFLAYLTACGFAVATYWNAERRLVTLNRRLIETNQALDRKVAERTAALRASEERFALAVHGSSDGIWDWNVLTNEAYYSPRLKELLGYQDEEIANVFASFEEHLHPADHDPIWDALRGHLEQRLPYDVEYRLRTKSGVYRWYRVRGQALWDESGRATRMAGSITDITERRQALEALREAKDLAQSASRAKSEFLASMSHELRTPLHGVLGMTELVLDTDLTPQQREFLTLVMESGEALLSIVNEILDFSKIEAGKVELERQAFVLRDLIGDTMKSLAIRAHRKQLELAYHLAPEVPDHLVGDPNRLRQVLLNLVGNAIKFTVTGEVVLRVWVLTRTDDAVELACEISDTGIGIPADKQALIFEAFTQADSSTTRRFGGTGLGLTICTRLVELMGGRIEVHSEVGRGSTFRFNARFELGPQLAEAPETLADPKLLGLSVLIVDDNATNRRILEELLHRGGTQPLTAANAAEAWAILARQQAAGRPIQLLLTDVAMPEMDGLMLCERIRQDPRLADLIIIVLTSGERTAAASECERLGVAAHLLKPVKPRELFEVIRHVAGNAASRSLAVPAPAPPRRRPLQHLRILVAEDGVVNQKLAARLLANWGHAVTIAENGRKAVEAWESRPYDLVLMDLEMPEMNGFEATEAIRRRELETGAHIPIIAITAHAISGYREQCLAVGMDGYVAKPIRQQELYDAIAAFFDASDAAPGSPRPAVEPAVER